MRLPACPHRWVRALTQLLTSFTSTQESVLEERAAEKEGQAFAPHVTIYSSHDSSVYSLLHALNNELGPQVWALPETTNGGIGSTAPAHLADIIDFAGEVPPYASTVTVAAWKDLEPVPASTNAEPDQEYVVRALCLFRAAQSFSDHFLSPLGTASKSRSMARPHLYQKLLSTMCQSA